MHCHRAWPLRREGALVLASLIGCGGSVTLDASAGGTGGATDGGHGGGALPAACVAAVTNIDWTDGGVDCTTAPTGWAAGLGASWREVFDGQCKTASSRPACITEAQSYFSCLAANGGTCNPCVSPNSGECKGSGGVVFSISCGAEETTLAQCLCKPPGAPCNTDLDCCAPATLALSCISNACTY